MEIFNYEYEYFSHLDLAHDEEQYHQLKQACKTILTNKNYLSKSAEKKEINLEEVTDYILSLGNYSNVHHFIHTACLKRLGKQKYLAEHWGIAESTLSSRINKTKYRS